MNDGADPSPLVARQRPRGFDDAVRVEALRWLDANETERGAHFIQADRAAWRGVSLPGRRIIVLSADEVAAMDRRFGRAFAVTFEPILLDARGQRALVRVDKGWTFDTIELKRIRGRWTVKVQAKVITRTPGFKSPRKALG